MVDDDGDPGWPISVELLAFVIPGVGFVRRRLLRRPPHVEDGLVFLRQLFLSFCSALAAIGVAVAGLHATGEAPTTFSSWVPGGLLLVGALVAIVGPKLEKPLNGEDVVHLLVTYRARFFLRMAVSQVAALLGFVGFILTYAPWSYAVGALITATGYARAAPTADHLRQDQERLTQAGWSTSLVEVLRMTRPLTPPT